MKTHLYFIIYALLTLTGSVILFFGIAPPAFIPPHIKAFEAVLQGFGGAIIGIGLSNIMSLIRTFDLFSEINKQITVSLGNEIKSDETSLQEYVGKIFYEYHTTKSHTHRDGAWILQPTEFFQSTLNTLSGKAVIEHDGGHAEYKCEVGMRGKHLIIIYSPTKGEESKGIGVFPEAGNACQKNILYGIAIGESLTGEHIVRSSILSKEPLTGQNTSAILPEKDWEKLNALWKKGFKMPFILTPSI